MGADFGASSEAEWVAQRHKIREKNDMKIVVVGLGYVGLSNAVLLAQHNEVIGVDITPERVEAVNSRKSPFSDTELSKYLAEKELDLCATTDLTTSLAGADYVIISTPTNYDDEKNFFDTSSVEVVISHVIKHEPNACIVVKSTIPVGFIDDVTVRLKTDAVMFSPEFLREGKALYDNLHPSRIIVGEKSKRAEVFAGLLAQGAIDTDIKIFYTGTREAEAIKLFSNTYLAMRVAFFNELDSYALADGIRSREIINGVSSDPRIGDHYNNPSFGYGGYCLPKDTKQLLADYNKVPQNLIRAIVDANITRKTYLANYILGKSPKVVGIYCLAMKAGSDNFRDSPILEIITQLQENGVDVIIYEPTLSTPTFLNCNLENNFEKFKSNTDLIIANRTTEELIDVKEKLFSRDIFNEN
jgi:UDPglucose 6-dehydrogenase